MTGFVSAVLVLVGGAVGATARYVLDGYVKSAVGKSLPWGTFAVNMAGTGLLGALHGAGGGTYVQALLGTGVAGALTTFSTFELDTVHLFQDRAYLKAAVNTVGMLLLGFATFLVTYLLFRWLS